jgi:BirA family biotin operon repressor/biotin-[acetyl-CoA-carboxylase] ligase
VRSVVVGIGCNVTWVGFPPELAETATACDREAGHAVDRGALLDALLDALAAELAALDAVPARYRSRLGTLGQEVRVELATGTLEGAAVDVDEHGRLAVQPPTGPPVLVGAGDVIHLRRVTDPGPRPPAP